MLGLAWRRIVYEAQTTPESSPLDAAISEKVLKRWVQCCIGLRRELRLRRAGRRWRR